MNKNFDPQKIEKTLVQAIISGDVSKSIFEGKRPNVNDTKMTDFVVVSVPTNISDLNALGRCAVRIELFAKNLSNGEKNSAKLSLMYSKLLSVFPIKDNTYLFDNNPTIIPLGDDGYGYYVNAIQIQTTIKTL